MSRRYPQVRRWMIWGEPNRIQQWQPQGKAGARRYALLLDTAYQALKAVDRKDVVIGGNTSPGGLDNAGGTSPRTWLRRLMLPSGRRPRLDMWGHNPFTSRPIDLRLRPVSRFSYDFNDVDTLTADLDRHYPRRLRVFLSESGTPTEHANPDWFFFTTREAQAARMRQMFNVAAKFPRIAALSNFLLYDGAGSHRMDDWPAYRHGSAQACLVRLSRNPLTRQAFDPRFPLDVVKPSGWSPMRAQSSPWSRGS